MNVSLYKYCLGQAKHVLQYISIHKKQYCWACNEHLQKCLDSKIRRRRTTFKSQSNFFQSLSDDYTGKKYNFLSFRIAVQPQADCVAFLEAVISDFSFLICDVGISEASISEVFLAMTSKGPPDTIVFASKLSSPPSPHPPSSSFPALPLHCWGLAFFERALSFAPAS